MSLDKAIAHGKEHRKPYYGSERFDLTCRPHGGKAHGNSNQCPYCLSNRIHGTEKRKPLEENADEE